MKQKLSTKPWKVTVDGGICGDGALDLSSRGSRTVLTSAPVTTEQSFRSYEVLLIVPRNIYIDMLSSEQMFVLMQTIKKQTILTSIASNH